MTNNTQLYLNQIIEFTSITLFSYIQYRRNCMLIQEDQTNKRANKESKDSYTKNQLKIYKYQKNFPKNLRKNNHLRKRLEIEFLLVIQVPLLIPREIRYLFNLYINREKLKRGEKGEKVNKDWKQDDNGLGHRPCRSKAIKILDLSNSSCQQNFIVLN